jgi:tetratricopeptide (TPR) repeat protein
MNEISNSMLISMSIHDLLLAAITGEDESDPQHRQEDILSELRSRLPTMSVFELLYTFLITNYADYFNPSEMFALLRERSGQEIGDNIDLWATWFIGLTDPYDKDKDPGSPWKLKLDPVVDRDKISISSAYGSYKFRRTSESLRKKRLAIRDRYLSTEIPDELSTFVVEKHSQDKLMEKLANLASKGELASMEERLNAMSLADDLIERFPYKIEGWCWRAFLHSYNNNYGQAVADISRVMDIDPKPHLFHTRGEYYFKLGNYQAAANDFSKLLDSEHYRDSEVYRKMIHFWRAESLLRLGKKQEALLEVAKIPEDGRTFTYKLRTRADLLADCEKLPD